MRSDGRGDERKTPPVDEVIVLRVNRLGVGSCTRMAMEASNKIDLAEQSTCNNEWNMWRFMEFQAEYSSRRREERTRAGWTTFHLLWYSRNKTSALAANALS